MAVTNKNNRFGRTVRHARPHNPGARVPAPARASRCRFHPSEGASYRCGSVCGAKASPPLYRPSAGAPLLLPLNSPDLSPTLPRPLANSSLTLLAVGFDDTERPVVGWRDGVREQQEIDPTGRRRAPALSAGEGSPAGPLYAPRSARISLPDH